MNEMLIWSFLRIFRNLVNCLSLCSIPLVYIWVLFASFLFVVISNNWTPLPIVMAWPCCITGYLHSLQRNEMGGTQALIEVIWVNNGRSLILEFTASIVNICFHRFFSVSLGKVSCGLLANLAVICPTWFSKLLCFSLSDVLNK